MYSTALRTTGWRSMPLALRVVLALGLALGIAALIASWQATHEANNAIDRVEQEGLRRDYELCLSSNEARAAIVHFIEQLVASGDEVSPAEQDAIDLAHESFAPLDCPPSPAP